MLREDEPGLAEAAAVHADRTEAPFCSKSNPSEPNRRMLRLMHMPPHALCLLTALLALLVACGDSSDTEATAIQQDASAQCLPADFKPAHVLGGGFYGAARHLDCDEPTQPSL